MPNYQTNRGNPSNPSAGQTQQSVLPMDERQMLQGIFTADTNGEKLVAYAERVGKRLVDEGLTRSQIRNIFSESRKIQTSWDAQNPKLSLRRLMLLKPKLAYQAAKENKAVLAYFRNVLSEAVDHVNKSADQTKSFEIFMQLFEAILAYHRSYGGK